MFDDEDLLPISALQHLVFCERQAALIHLERQWADNALTVEGQHLHRSVDGGARAREARQALRIVRGMMLHSSAYGLIGKADAVELVRDEAAGSTIRSLPGKWRVVPVEYKRGRPKRDRCDEVQLCAQALCLEEMMEMQVNEGALYYGRTRHRIRVAIDPALRRFTSDMAVRLHAILSGQATPLPEYGPKCKRCSLAERCLPQTKSRETASAYLARSLWERGS